MWLGISKQVLTLHFKVLLIYLKLITMFNQITKTPPKSNHLGHLRLVALLSSACLMLLAIRMAYTERVSFIFLSWNLFLGILPLVVSTYLTLWAHKFSKLRHIILPVALWILLFPNAPYIVTDLMHLKMINGPLYWYDLLLILSFAFVGLLAGYYSLRDIFGLISKLNPVVAKPFVVFCLAASGPGIYIGRYLRWNSWDIILHPLDFTYSVLVSLQHPVAIAISGTFSLMVALVFAFFYLSSKLDQAR